MEYGILQDKKNLETYLSLPLKETFIKMDEIMTTKDSIEEIKQYARKSKEDDDLLDTFFIFFILL